jgi:hypothetical protein
MLSVGLGKEVQEEVAKTNKTANKIAGIISGARHFLIRYRFCMGKL